MTQDREQEMIGWNDPANWSEPIRLARVAQKATAHEDWQREENARRIREHQRKEDKKEREQELESRNTRPGATIIPGPPRASRFFSAAVLGDRPVPAREWLVNDLVPMNTVTLFGGDGGTGKSLLALQLAVAVATGTAWLGRATRPGPVIFITAEDDEAELHRRLDDILRAEGASYGEIADLTLRSLAGEDALLAIETHAALVKSALFEELAARAEQETPALVIIDTLADVYPANENDRAKVRQFVGILRSLALRRRCAVMVLAHPSLAGLTSGSGTSGSTAWNNSVRSRLYLARVEQDGYEPNPNTRMLTNKKANYGPLGVQIAMTWHAGVFVADIEPDGLDRLAAGAKAERVFLTLLRQFTEQGRRVNHAGGPTYAPNVFAASAGAEGMTKKALRAAMESLLHRGAIRIAKEGRSSKERQFLEVSE